MESFEKRIYLSSPTMHGEEFKYMSEAYRTNWMSTVGANINAIESNFSEMLGANAVALSSGTAALHLAVKLAGVEKGDVVLCSDVTFAATVNPVVYEGGTPVFIDSERRTWNMDPEALEHAFKLYPKAKAVIAVNLYGTPAELDTIADICHRYGAILIEDAAESLGATYKGRQTGTFGDINAISFNGNKIITGSSGGMLLTRDKDAAARAVKWSTQSRERAPWYQHEELGYNYRMSNVVAGVVRGQIPHLHEHIAQKKAIYERYREGFRDLPVDMAPFDRTASSPNFWLSCITVRREAMACETRSDSQSVYRKEKGKSCPGEILDVLARHNAEGRPVWKPMHLQPIFRGCDFVSAGDNVGEDVFARGVCLPSDNKMTKSEQDKIIELVRSTFEE